MKRQHSFAFVQLEHGCCRLAGEPLKLLVSELAVQEVAALAQQVMASFKGPALPTNHASRPEALEPAGANTEHQPSVSHAHLQDPAQIMHLTNECPVPIVFSQVCVQSG